MDFIPTSVFSLFLFQMAIRRRGSRETFKDKKSLSQVRVFKPCTHAYINIFTFYQSLTFSHTGKVLLYVIDNLSKCIIKKKKLKTDVKILKPVYELS